MPPVSWSERRGVYATSCIQHVTVRWGEIMPLGPPPVYWRMVGGVCNFLGTTCYSAANTPTKSTQHICGPYGPHGLSQKGQNRCCAHTHGPNDAYNYCSTNMV